jgi:mono/diheme cytochrome c family protein
MRVRALPVGILLLIVVGLVVVLRHPAIPTSAANKPWPAPVKADEPEKSVPLTPKDELATFTMPPGYHVELVASEPLVKDPILMEFDGDGRLWVMELPAFSINDQMENSFEPINDLVVLEDTDHDGVFDKRTVFMDKLVFPRAFKILDKNCALVGAPPNLWKACDTDGDLKADTRELISKTFSTQGVVEHGANGLYWGMDNTIYVSEHNWDVEFKAGKFQTRPSLRRGQWGVSQDNGGRIFRNVNTDPLFVDYVAPKYYVRNPNQVRTDGLYESLVKQEDTLIWPIHPTLGVNRGYRSDIFRADQSSTYYGGVSSPLIYRGQSLPADVQNQPFVVDGPTNIVHLLKLTNDSGKLAATDYYKQGEFLASTDVRFRPVALSGGWDGTIWIADMYRGISQDGPIQTDYLRDFNAKHDLARGLNYGRIYRVVHDGMKVDERPAMSKETPAQLVAHLSHANGWWRDTAQQLLVQRGDKSVVPALEQLAATAPDPAPRLHALWTLDGLDALRPELVVAALKDESPDVRAAALRLSEHWLATDSTLQAAVTAKLDDSSWFVRRQLAATLGELPREARLAPVMQVLKKYGDDSMTVDAALSGIAGQEGEALTLLVKDPAPGADAIAMLAGAASKGRDPATVQALLNLAGDSRQPVAVRVAVMDGVAQGLKAAAGGGGGGGGAVAGGRAGGGVPGVVRGRSSTSFPIAASPRALLAMSTGKDALAAPATTMLALLDWPGKPAPPAVAPMTAEDEKRFAAGKETYQKICVACHTAEGTGIEHIGAKLVGSKWANGETDPAIRILMNGKEGTVGLMPPLGAALSDEEAASVLTFVRRSFGNKGAPVLPAEVKETRQAYLHRTTPWTEAELAVRRR